MRKRKPVYFILILATLLLVNSNSVFGSVSHTSKLSNNEINNEISHNYELKATSPAKLAALTFDDGPDNNYTLKILEVLKKYDIKATFFIVGSRAKAYPDVVKRIVNDGHVIGNHTWDHQNFLKLSDDNILAEVLKTEEELYKITGCHTTLVRPPYGNTNSHINEMLAAKGYNIVLWSVDTKDWEGNSVNSIMKCVQKEIRPGGIILQHCRGKVANTVKALPQIIAYLKKKGYSFATVPDLLNIPADTDPSYMKGK